MRGPAQVGGTRRRAVALLLALSTVALAGCSLAPAVPKGAATSAASVSSGDPSSTAGDVSMGLTRYAPGERKPTGEISGTTLDGAPLSLASLAGRVVVVNAWASWCDPCREELPLLAAAQRAADPDAVAFLGLDVNDSREAAIAMETAAGVDYPSLIDQGARLLARIPGVPPSAIPSTVVLDKQGRVAARIIGTVKPGMLEPVIAELSAE